MVDNILTHFADEHGGVALGVTAKGEIQANEMIAGNIVRSSGIYTQIAGDVARSRVLLPTCMLAWPPKVLGLEV